MPDIITFFQDVVYAHLHPDLYWEYIVAFDVFFLIIFLFFWHFVYMGFRKQLHIRDLAGRDEVIGLILSKKKWPRTPHDMPSEWLIKFRRRGLYFFKDLIHPLRLYYLPPESLSRPFFIKWRHIYIVGGHQVYKEHPDSLHENYYYLAPGARNRGIYERASDYMIQGMVYLKGVGKTCHMAIQSDADLASKRITLDSVAIDLPTLDKLDYDIDKDYMIEG